MKWYGETLRNLRVMNCYTVGFMSEYLLAAEYFERSGSGA